MLQAREYLSKLGDLSQTQIFAKIENVEVRYLLDTVYALRNNFDAMCVKNN